ncbi:hypothetical protein [uncultured Cardiobacterium sp.]|nr:hypothetical protein [uncultured Cardiobacterium sp.]
MRNRLPWRWQLAALPLFIAAIWFTNLREEQAGGVLKCMLPQTNP